MKLVPTTVDWQQFKAACALSVPSFTCNRQIAFGMMLLSVDMEHVEQLHNVMDAYGVGRGINRIPRNTIYVHTDRFHNLVR